MLKQILEIRKLRTQIQQRQLAVVRHQNDQAVAALDQANLQLRRATQERIEYRRASLAQLKNQLVNAKALSQHHGSDMQWLSNERESRKMLGEAKEISNQYRVQLLSEETTLRELQKKELKIEEWIKAEE